MTDHIRNIVLEGGGVKGIAYVGALEVLESSGILQNIKRVGGTSAGAINATLLGLRYSNAEILDEMNNLDFNDFMDSSWFPGTNIARLATKYGWYKGDAFRKWIGGIIEKKTGNSESTFKEAMDQDKFREMSFIGTNISTGFGRVFSYEHTPDIKIADAVRISMSIPLFFAAKRMEDGDLYVDGGALNNYPVKLYDRKKYVESENSVPTKDYDKHNKDLSDKKIDVSEYVCNNETLGFRLDTKKEIAVFRWGKEPERNKTDSLISYFKALVGTLVDSQSSSHLQSHDHHRTVYVDTLDVGTVDFDLSDEKKNQLIESGRKSMTSYLEWYAKEESNPLNKPS